MQVDEAVTSLIQARLDEYTEEGNVKAAALAAISVLLKAAQEQGLEVKELFSTMEDVADCIDQVKSGVAVELMLSQMAPFS